MKKILLMFLILLTMISVASAADSQYGIYIKDTSYLEADVSDAKVTYLRDNFYGVAYIDTSGNGYVRVIETSGYSITNSSVDEWNFGTGATNLDFMSFNNATGLSVVSYTSASVSRYKSFDIYANGTINSRSSASESSSTFNSLKTIKTSNTTFMTSMVSSNWAPTVFIYNTGYTVSADGTLTESAGSAKTYSFESTTTGISYIDMAKVGSTCYIFFKENSLGKYESIGCSDLEWTSGGISTASATRIYSSTFESNEIYEIDADYDEDAGFIYITYSETLDKYPVVSVRNATDFSLLEKKRLFDNTTANNRIFTLSSNYFLSSYTLDDALYAHTYSVELNGTINEEYDELIYIDSGFSDLIKMPTTDDNYLLGFETYSDLSLRTLGIGLVPPPNPEDTQITIKDEKTLGAFDDTDLVLTFTALCTNNTEYETVINSSVTDIPVDCEYTSFSMRVAYDNEYNVTESYTRYYLRDLTDTYEQFNLDVYLINPYDTDFVITNVIVDDLRSKYTNAEIYFDKNINGEETQITAFTLDLEQKMKAVLMTDDIYYVYIDSDETSRQFLGMFVTADAGTVSDTKVFYLYDIDTTFDYDSLERNFQYIIQVDNHTIEGIAKTYSGSEDTLMNITLELFNGTSVDSTLIDTYTAGSLTSETLYSFLSTGELDYSDYINDSVFARLTIYYYVNGEQLHIVGTNQLWIEDERITLPLMTYVDQSFMDWFLLILFSVIALFATIQTANIASISLIGLASLFVIFGWFSVSTGTLAVAALISLISLIVKKGGTE